ncbi:hypothetical protein [Armatimonas sp.]|uniref:hypothetical protein n=1 Tax=Armatimonas sp. TaxID=1872638 RepID=UPI0037505C86
MGTIDLDYLQKRKKYRNSFHTVDAVMQSLEKVAPPRGWNLPQGIKTAQEVFVGYLMLDALIGNGDRHDENWAVVEGISGIQQALAPTFDHASSLGMLLGDEERRQRLTTKDQGYSVAVYANKATSALYQGVSASKPLSTLAAFEEAGSMYPQAAHLWLAQLSLVTIEDFEEELGKIPKNRISVMATDFALRLLAHNMARLQKTL